MSEKEISKSFILTEETKQLTISYLRTQTYSDVNDAIIFLENSTIIDQTSFQTLFRYLSLKPWLEVDALIKEILATTTESIDSTETSETSDSENLQENNSTQS